MIFIKIKIFMLNIFVLEETEKYKKIKTNVTNK